MDTAKVEKGNEHRNRMFMVLALLGKIDGATRTNRRVNVRRLKLVRSAWFVVACFISGEP